MTAYLATASFFSLLGVFVILVALFDDRGGPKPPDKPAWHDPREL